MKAKALCFALTIFLTAGAPGHAAVFMNGSFEDTTNFVDNTGQDNDSLTAGSTVMPGWTVSATHKVSWIGPTNPFGGQASSGNYFLDLTDYSDGAPYGGVSQTFTTSAGHTYQVNFDLGSSTNYGAADGIMASAAGFSQTFNSNNPGSTNYWETETFKFVANSGTSTLNLVGSSGSAYIGLDNVVVTDLGSAVPEASTWAMMLLGFAGIGFAGYRSSRKSSASVV